MLVLSRKSGQSIILDDNIEITVTRIGNGRVGIGISAPHDVHIRRAELMQWERQDRGMEPELDRQRSSYGDELEVSTAMADS